MFKSFNSLKKPYERFLCNGNNVDPETGETMQDRLRTMRHATAKSKSGVWGPTHSFDSDEDENDAELLNKTSGDRSGGTNTTEDSFSSYKDNSPFSKDNEGKSMRNPQSNGYINQPPKPSPFSPLHCTSSNDNGGIIAGIFNVATAAYNELIVGDCNVAWNQCQGNGQFKRKSRKYGNSSAKDDNNENEQSNISATLGIERLSPPSMTESSNYQKSNASSLTDGIKSISLDFKTTNFTENGPGDEDARAASKKMADVTKRSSRDHKLHSEKGGILMKRPSLSDCKRNNIGRAPPFTVIKFSNSVPFQKSISELTMRSSYGEATMPVSDMRRMAYYAVGKNHSPKGTKKSNNGGNRKCYFTGEPIISGRPFYAGSVQQGMRTLIVFCLPSAIGLPKKEDLDRITEIDMNFQLEGRRCVDGLSRRTITGLSTAALSQHDSIYNDEGFVTSEGFHQTAWTEDENGNICENLNAEVLLRSLPDSDKDLLLTMQESFPDQFASLSPHLRRPQCWRLYVKFCFFSGLPIADGEMYYKVIDDVVTKAGGNKSTLADEIILSHEVMEAVSGESADLRILPGNNVFKYLRKHYKQQCAKLTPQKLANKVFDRSSWIRVMPEV